MATTTRTATHEARPRPARRKDAAAPVPGDPTSAPSAYNRSALPVALSWFVIPALLLVLSEWLGWKLF